MTCLGSTICRSPWPTRIIIWVFEIFCSFRADGKLIQSRLTSELVFAKYEDAVMGVSEAKAIIRRGAFLPNNIRKEVRTAKHLITEHFQIMSFIFVDSNPNRSIVAQKTP